MIEACKVKVCLHPVDSETWTYSSCSGGGKKQRVKWWLLAEQKSRRPQLKEGSSSTFLGSMLDWKEKKVSKKASWILYWNSNLFWWKTWKAQLEKWNLVVVHSKLSLPHRVRFAVWCLEVESWHWFIPKMGDDHAHNARDIYMHLLLYSFPIRQGTGPSPYIATLNHVKLENVLKTQAATHFVA